jgi:hypothetical protein
VRSGGGVGNKRDVYGLSGLGYGKLCYVVSNKHCIKVMETI